MFHFSAISTTTVPWSQNDQEYGNLQISERLEGNEDEEKI